MTGFWTRRSYFDFGQWQVLLSRHNILQCLRMRGVVPPLPPMHSYTGTNLAYSIQNACGGTPSPLSSEFSERQSGLRLQPVPRFTIRGFLTSPQLHAFLTWRLIVVINVPRIFETPNCRRGWTEFIPLLGYYAPQFCLQPTFRDYLSAPFLKVKLPFIVKFL